MSSPARCSRGRTSSSPRAATERKSVSPRPPGASDVPAGSSGTIAGVTRTGLTAAKCRVIDAVPNGSATVTARGADAHPPTFAADDAVALGALSVRRDAIENDPTAFAQRRGHRVLQEQDSACQPGSVLDGEDDLGVAADGELRRRDGAG